MEQFAVYMIVVPTERPPANKYFINFCSLLNVTAFEKACVILKKIRVHMIDQLCSFTSQPELVSLPYSLVANFCTSFTIVS